MGKKRKSIKLLLKSKFTDYGHFVPWSLRSNHFVPSKSHFVPPNSDFVPPNSHFVPNVNFTIKLLFSIDFLRKFEVNGIAWSVLNLRLRTSYSAAQL